MNFSINTEQNEIFLKKKMKIFLQAIFFAVTLQSLNKFFIVYHASSN